MIIDNFLDQYFFLNNFSASPMHFLGKLWPTVEHLYQALKTTDTQQQEIIRQAPTPVEAKHLGRELVLSDAWLDIKESMMRVCLRQKFLQNPVLFQKLLLTGESQIIEGNTWHDNIWGDCYCVSCKSITGKNLLGKLLMELRTEWRMQTPRLKLLVPSPSSRLFPEVCHFLRTKGINIQLAGKELFRSVGHLDIFFTRGFDIPKALAAGWADLGMTGVDAVYESDELVPILSELGVRYSDVIVASSTLQNIQQLCPGDTVVTEYHKITREFFSKHAIHNLNFLHVTGAAEAYALMPEVAAIVTLKTSGKSLIDNQLNTLATAFKSQVCLAASPIALQRMPDLIQHFKQILGITTLVSRGEHCE